MGFVRKFPDQTKHKNSIFKIDHKNKLDLSYIPQRLPNREKHIKEIINQFKPVINGNTSSYIPILIHGSTGTGKTSSTKIALDKIINDKNRSIVIKHVYVNCTIFGKTFLVVQQIAEKITSLPSRGLGEAELFSKIYKELETRDDYLILVLDDLDDLILNDRGRLLYMITRLEEISEFTEKRLFIILIMRKQELLSLLDPSIISKIAGLKIPFNPYTWSEIKDIVKQRVELAFIKDVISENAIRQISFNGAYLSGGDARYPISLLRRSGEVAIENSKKRINVEDVRKAQQTMDDYMPHTLETEMNKNSLSILFKIITIFYRSQDTFSVKYDDILDILDEKEENNFNVPKINKKDVRESIEKILDTGILQKSKRNLILSNLSAEFLYHKLREIIGSHNSLSTS